MGESTKNLQVSQLEPECPPPIPEGEIRRRINDLIQAGGVYPISVTGVRNIAKMMRISQEGAAKIIREETERLAGRGGIAE